VSSSLNFKDVRRFLASVGFWLGHKSPFSFLCRCCARAGETENPERYVNHTPLLSDAATQIGRLNDRQRDIASGSPNNDQNLQAKSPQNPVRSLLCRSDMTGRGKSDESADALPPTYSGNFELRCPYRLQSEYTRT
jgi:hypothetical protein